MRTVTYLNVILGERAEDFHPIVLWLCLTIE